MSLWISNRGEVACGRSATHGGAYLMSATDNGSKPLVTVDTPLDTWKLIPESVAKEFDLKCEGCVYEPPRPDPLPMGVQQAEGG